MYIYIKETFENQRLSHNHQLVQEKYRNLPNDLIFLRGKDFFFFRTRSRICGEFIFNEGHQKYI